LLRNEGKGIRLSFKFKTSSILFETKITLRVKLNMYSSQNRKILLRGTSNEGEDRHFWVMQTWAEDEWRDIRTTVDFDHLRELWFESDAHQFAISEMKLFPSSKMKSANCDFSCGTTCDFEVEGSSEAYEVIRDLSLQTDKVELHHIPWNWDEHPADKPQTELLSIEKLANADQSAPVAYLKVKSNNFLILSWPVQSYKTGNVNGEQLIFEFLYYKKYETQKSVQLYIGSTKSQVIWNSLEEPANERYPWRLVRVAFSFALSTLSSWFEIYGDGHNALAQIRRYELSVYKQQEFQNPFTHSLDKFERLQHLYGGGFLVGPLRSQDLHALKTLHLDASNMKYAFADFTGPFAPSHTGQLAWTDLVSASSMELLSKPFTIHSIRKEACVQLDVAIWTDKSSPTESSHPAFEFVVIVDYGHFERVVGRIYSTSQKMVKLLISVEVIDRPRILFRAARLHSHRKGIIALRNFHFHAGECPKMKLLEGFEQSDRQRDISCAFNIDFCGWRNEASFNWEVKKVDDNPSEVWQSSMNFEGEFTASDPVISR
jgi:hypothetical protein